MAVQTGINKKVAFGKEVSTSWNVASTLPGQYLRRVTSDIDLAKDTFQSNEMRADYQIADVRHGVRKVSGGIKGELSPGAYSAFIGSGLRKDFTALAADTNLSCTVAGTWSATSPIQTITTPAGRLAKGWKAGMALRLTTGTNLPNNVGRNFFLTNVTDTTFSGIAWPPTSGLDTSGSGTMTGVTFTAVGKYTRTPISGHTNDSYSIEHYFADLTQSELFTGCRVASIDFGLPSTGIATCDVGFMGGNVVTAGAQKFSSATAASSGGLLTAVNGVVAVSGAVVGTLQSLSIKFEGGTTTGTTVGSNITPDVFQGRVKVTGQLVAYFDSVTMRDYFLSETKFEILAIIYSDNTNTADLMSFAMYNCKAMGAAKSDGEQGLTITMPFQALYNPVASDTTDDTLQTTMMVQDSLA